MKGVFCGEQALKQKHKTFCTTSLLLVAEWKQKHISSCSRSWLCDHGLSRTSCPWSGRRAWRKTHKGLNLAYLTHKIKFHLSLELNVSGKNRSLIFPVGKDWSRYLNEAFHSWAFTSSCESQSSYVDGSSIILEASFVWDKVLEFILFGNTFPSMPHYITSASHVFTC